MKEPQSPLGLFPLHPAHAQVPEFVLDVFELTRALQLLNVVRFNMHKAVCV